MGKLKHLKNSLDMAKAARMKRAAEQGFEPGYYKGMYPYDWTKEKGDYIGPEITEINRTTPFPSFGGADGDVEGIAGFLTKDPAVASRFAQPPSKTHPGGAVYPLMYRKGRELIIDAKDFNPKDSKFGHAAAVQFGETGRTFRDAVRSGDYDTITIKGTLDEGDVTVALTPENIRSVNAAFDPANIGKSDILGNVDPRLLGATAAAGGAAALSSQDAEAAPMGTLAKLKGITTRQAHHGSPHDFDQFSLSKIGTGEGAQAYGHGLYFSSKDEIAKFYRDSLTPKGRAKYKGEEIIRGDLNSVNAGGRSTAENFALRQLIDSNGDVEQARNILLSQAKDPAWKNSYEKAASMLDDIAKEFEAPAAGKLYTVEIPDESLMLDWDKPLSEQPEALQKAVQPLIEERRKVMQSRANIYTRPVDEIIAGMKGEQLYDLFQVAEGRPDLASAKLRELGIPGITYKGATSDERNFVVFDDELINILEKGNATPAGMAIAGGAAAAEFGRRRAQKSKFWDDLKGVGEAALTVGTGLVGGAIGDLSRLGGYLNPFMPVEATEQGADALSQRLTYQPSGAAEPYLAPLSRGLETFEQDINRGIPEGLKNQWNSANPRLKGIAEMVLF